MKGVRWEEGRSQGQEAFAGARGRVALFLGRSLGASGVRREQGHSQGRVAMFLGRSQGQGAFAGCKKRVYDFFAADVSFFVNLNFMYIFIIIFEG